MKKIVVLPYLFFFALDSIPLHMPPKRKSTTAVSSTTIVPRKIKIQKNRAT
jgi:hypothetical protein